MKENAQKYPVKSKQATEKGIFTKK